MHLYDRKSHDCLNLYILSSLIPKCKMNIWTLNEFEILIFRPEEYQLGSTFQKIQKEF